ncbi:MAG TPA: NAD-dependent epimerase/dehydratase family protein [Candidatus Absconditabacterales bacterium]|nr:NAD-dependent epimerase/dehydratase family protein [Candidatus Absconditabacterales bacterium]
MSETILITGTSGFIGFHLAKKLLEEGRNVIGFDNENDYYDVDLKISRRNILEKYDNFKFYKGNLENLEDLKRVFEENKIDKVCNLAAQAGVLYSIKNPFSYIQTNIVGFHNILDLSKNYKVKNFVYASTASVYGGNTPPFSVEDKTDQPLTLYGATKKSNELIAHSYSHIFDFPTTGLRFFNVLGPAGRPDGSLYIFVDSISKGKPIRLFNHGNMKRNFTHVYDIIEGVVKALDNPTKYEIYNLGNTNIVELNYFVDRIEQELGKKAEKILEPMQLGEIIESKVDIQHTIEGLGRKPKLDVDVMVKDFVDRYKQYKG